MSGGAKLAIGIGIVAVIVGGAYLGGGSRGGGRQVEVRMDQVAKRDLVAAVTASGQIEAKKDVNISSEVTAKIIKLHVKEGDMVKEGELLVELDQTQFQGAVQRSQAAVATAQAGALQAKVTRDQSKATLDRLRNLKRLDPTGVTDSDLETATSNFAVAEANLTSMASQVDQAKASLKEAQDNLARTRITSPISGRVVRLAREEGEVAVPGTFSADVGLIMRIADLSTILAKVKVNETDVVHLALKDSVSVSIDAFPDTTFLGRVTKIANAAQASTATTGTSTDKAVDFEVEVTLVNPPHDVRPDLSMTARIITDVRKGVLSIPTIALTARAIGTPTTDTKATTPIPAPTPGDTAAAKKVKQQFGVFVVENGVALFRPVKEGISGDEYIEVLTGLKEGETVVSGTYQAIRDMKDSTRVKAAPATTGTAKKP